MSTDNIYPHAEIKTWVKMPNSFDVLIKLDDDFYVNPKYYSELSKSMIEYRLIYDD